MDKFIFDYNVVRALDPSYEKYLYNETVNPFGMQDINSGIVDRVHAQANRFVSKDGLDDAERDVVNMMHDTNKTAPPVEAVENTHPFPDMVAQDAGDSEESKSKWMLRHEYATQPLNGRKMNPLQLLPPKSVLDEGSVIHRTPQTVYKFRQERHRGMAKSISRSRFSDASDRGKLRLINSTYWFEPVHNTMSEKKATFQSLVYNTKSRRMYSRRYESTGAKGTKNRYKATVRGVAFNTGTLHRVYSSMPAEIYLQFVQRLREVVLEDVPDAHVPHGEFLDKLLCSKSPDTAVEVMKIVYLTGMLVLQHKASKRIDWLDNNTFYKVSSLLNEQHISNYLKAEANLSQLGELSKAFLNYRRYRLAAIRKCVKDKPGLKSFVKALFGKQYRKIAFTMMLHNIDSHDLSQILATVIDGRMPKNIYHYIVNLMKGMKGELKGNSDESETLSTIAGIITGREVTDLKTQRLYTCLKTYEKFGRAPGHHGWTRWRDMYNMAEELHIRIRPNKFASEDDIDALHDGLAVIRNRDIKIRFKYEGVEFEPFAHPDKEYGDGFRFMFLATPADLTHEGTTMHHCVGSYADSCIQGRSIIFSMRKGDRGYITIELDGETYEIRQKYTIRDHTVENQDILNIIAEWRGDVLEMHMNEDRSNSYRTICDQKIIKQEEARRKEAQKQLAENGAINGMIRAAQRPAPATDGDDLADMLDAIRGADVAHAV